LLEGLAAIDLAAFVLRQKEGAAGLDLQEVSLVRKAMVGQGFGEFFEKGLGLRRTDVAVVFDGNVADGAGTLEPFNDMGQGREDGPVVRP